MDADRSVDAVKSNVMDTINLSASARPDSV